MRVFVDTSAWLAIEIEHDVCHKTAIVHLEKLKKQQALLVINDYVLAETITRLIYDVHLQAARIFWEKTQKGLKDGSLLMWEVDSILREKTWQELERFKDHKLSFIDATIVVNFKDNKLDEVFTFDSHFRDINLPTNKW